MGELRRSGTGCFRSNMDRPGVRLFCNEQNHRHQPGKAQLENVDLRWRSDTQAISGCVIVGIVLVGRFGIRFVADACMIIVGVNLMNPPYRLEKRVR